VLGSDHPVVVDVVCADWVVAVVVELFLDAALLLLLPPHSLHFAQQILGSLGKRLFSARVIIFDRGGSRSIVDNPL
jgi:hypothetical protein